eukprot:CAMPEP_0172673470 /NCGR_PEP_ID=MMETSP1074-20121228/12166_1 /TAXON_ID=2916 /ORGANISM="Ceratium fusus, Strain PA161109" /LENGTH=119 /DNA_ID=CAMNT_0013490773 /DNA_START=115 /DNA_END=470 /DNA_ORIENTATION=+
MAFTLVSQFSIAGTLPYMSLLWCSANGWTGSCYIGIGGSSVWPQRLRLCEARAHASLNTVLHGNHGAFESDLTNIGALLHASFEAIPRNSLGRLAPQSVGHMIHNYFAEQHGLSTRSLG